MSGENKERRLGFGLNPPRVRFCQGYHPLLGPVVVIKAGMGGGLHTYSISMLQKTYPDAVLVEVASIEDL